MTAEPSAKGDPTPRGIGGWLLIPIGGLLFAAISGLWSIYGVVSFAPARELALAFDPASLTINFLGVAISWGVLPLIPLALLLLRSRHFPSAFIIAGVCLVAFGFISPFVEAIDYPLDPGAFTNAIIPAIWVAGWSWYILKSARVRNTFVS